MRRRKNWEEEQLRKKMEEEIFGTPSEDNLKLNENKSNKEEVDQILQKSKKNSKTEYIKYLILFFIVCIGFYIST